MYLAKCKRSSASGIADVRFFLKNFDSTKFSIYLFKGLTEFLQDGDFHYEIFDFQLEREKNELQKKILENQSSMIVAQSPRTEDRKSQVWVFLIVKFSLMVLNILKHLMDYCFTVILSKL